MRYLSLFSGIEAATVAWHPLGFEPVAFSEIDPFCCSLLTHRFPEIPNLGDVTKITPEQIKALGQIDLVVFGSPCQDLSVSGKRRGLSGDRSGLFRDAISVIQWARDYCQCRFSLWENVPGTFSSAKGRDFSEVLHRFTGAEFAVPEKGWQTSGAGYGPDALVEWRILDAQYFGVPQRRRRLFAFVDFGDWSDRRPVLFESQGVSGNPDPGRTQEQEITGPPESRASECGSNHIVVDCRQDPVVSDKVMTVDSGIPHSNAVMMSAFDLQGFGHYTNKGTASSLQQRDYKYATDLVTYAPHHVIPIHDQATRFAGKRAAKQDGKGNGLGIGLPGDPANTLTSADRHAVASTGCVRRLTPLECERLQGFSDNWTQIPWKSKAAVHCPATPRYKCIGNSMAVPVMRWIGTQIGLMINEIQTSANACGCRAL